LSGSDEIMVVINPNILHLRFSIETDIYRLNQTLE